MTSKNFDFLRPAFNPLADEATYAEGYAHSDPSAALWKLRVFAERAVAIIYLMRRLPRPFRAELNDCLQEAAFTQSVPRVVIDKLDLLRLRGNKAAHGEQFAPVVALQLLREAFDIATWIHLAVANQKRDLLPQYTPPVPASPAAAAPAIDTKALEARAAVLEQELERERARFEALLADVVRGGVRCRFGTVDKVQRSETGPFRLVHKTVEMALVEIPASASKPGVWKGLVDYLKEKFTAATFTGYTAKNVRKRVNLFNPERVAAIDEQEYGSWLSEKGEIKFNAKTFPLGSDGKLLAPIASLNESLTKRKGLMKLADGG